MKIYTKILLGLVLGAVVGTIANLAGPGVLRTTVVALDPIGSIFIRLMTMIVVPLVVASLLVGIAALGDIHKLSRIGARAITYFIATTALAAATGLVIALIMKPGAGLDPAVRDGLTAKFSAEAGKVGAATKAAPGIIQTLVEAVPRNPVQAAANGDLLAVIVCTLIFGAAASALPEETRRPFIAFFDAVNRMSLIVIGWVMQLAPYAVFALIASVIAQFGFDLLRSLAYFCVVVIVGEVLYGIGVISFIVRFMARMNPLTFYRRIGKVMLVSFSTSSSNATLPVSIEVAEKDLEVPKEIAGFVLPLGATLNKNGSALYKPVAVVFIAAVYGIHLTVAQQLTIVFASVVSATSGAGAPGTGMVTILIVLNAAGLNAWAEAGVALVIGVDRILDMIRTTVNVVGNMAGAAYIARKERANSSEPDVQRHDRGAPVDVQYSGVGTYDGKV